jgi:hypothetical protein
MELILKNNFSKYWNASKRWIYSQEKNIRTLDKIERDLSVKKPSDATKKPIKILMTSFSIFPPCFFHDRILSYALRLKGATIIPIYCDSIQTIECNACGGVWIDKPFEESCNNCREKSELLWHNNPTKPLQLSKFINKSEILGIESKIKSLDSNWFDYHEGSFLFGKWAKDILVNNYVVGDYHLIPKYDDLGKNHVRNLLLLKTAYHNIVNEVKPDRVIANDSYYGMWAILQKICEENKIPFYSHWMGGRPNGWCYAYNDAAMNLDFSKVWKSFADITLNERQTKKVKDWIDSRHTGKNMVLDTASLQAFNTDEFDFSKIDKAKPIALLPSNVIWDLAALNKQIVFSDMIDWIVKTIHWFENHPEYQLIIKPHPAELYPGIPETTERVEVALSQRNITLPENVFVLTPHVNCTVYDLLPISTVGIVHTTTVGVEMAALGIPVITTANAPYRGFGFTIDPVSQDEYFNSVEKALSGKLLLETDRQIENAYKFIFFYHFHYYINIGFMNYVAGKKPQLKIKSLSDLSPGKNQYLDYIVDSILDGKSIISKNRWPPES